MYSRLSKRNILLLWLITVISTLYGLLLIIPADAMAKQEDMQLITGPDAGTYRAFGDNIAALNATYNQNIKVLPSLGSIDNIKRMVEGKGKIALGIVQSDILGFMKRSSNANTQKVADSLSLVFPFYEEEVHILARKHIKGLRDLRNKKVVIGEQGSGNMLTAINIMALAEIQAKELLHLPPAEGIVAVLAGDADAMIFVGGKPVPFFSNLAKLQDAEDEQQRALLQQVHFVAVDDQRVYAEYSPTRITKEDYGFVNQTVLTAKVTAVLISYNKDAQQMKPNSAHCKALQQVADAIHRNLDDLRETGHPKWQEVNLMQEVTQWKRNSCVWEGKRFIPASTPVQQEALTKDLLDIVKYGEKEPKGKEGKK